MAGSCAVDNDPDSDLMTEKQHKRFELHNSGATRNGWRSNQWQGEGSGIRPSPPDEDQAVKGQGEGNSGGKLPPLSLTPNRSRSPIECIAGGKRPQESDFTHCPTPQSYVRCGPHGRGHLKNVLDQNDVDNLHELWWRYRDDLSWPWYDKKPEFAEEDYDTFRFVVNKVLNAMVEFYKEPMVLDQATISNTNHIGHPPHADNVQFDSVWWKGKKQRTEDEVKAAQQGAYTLWRSEKTSYRSYSCSTALSDPNKFDGGEVQFFDNFGDKDPVESIKCDVGCSYVFCGCQRNIHAVTGVRRGFRLVLLVWTRPPGVRVPDGQRQVCYFRPGTGMGVWLTTADVMVNEARKRTRETNKTWVPKDDDDCGCMCDKCVHERKKLVWKGSSTPTTVPTTGGNSPASSGQDSTGTFCSALSATPRKHCPHEQVVPHCKTHAVKEIDSVLNEADIGDLHRIWKKHKDDLSNPWYDKKPEFSQQEFIDYRRCAQKVVDAMAVQFGEDLVLDQATISSTTSVGHPPHADNVQFDSVWWEGQIVRQRDELIAAREGAEVYWKKVKTGYRNYSVSVALTNPWQYGGGDLEFYDEWGQCEPSKRYRLEEGNGVASCGCQRSIHAVTSVKWGFRLVLLVWTRSPDVEVPEDQKHVCYFRPGTSLSVWLTIADMERHGQEVDKKMVEDENDLEDENR